MMIYDNDDNYEDNDDNDNDDVYKKMNGGRKGGLKEEKEGCTESPVCTSAPIISTASGALVVGGVRDIYSSSI